MKCSWIQVVLALLILVFVIWPTQIFSASASMVIVIVSAALLLIHALGCKKCCGACWGSCSTDVGKMKKPMAMKKKKRR